MLHIDMIWDLCVRSIAYEILTIDRGLGEVFQGGKDALV